MHNNQATKDRSVEEDFSADKPRENSPLPPGPPDADDVDFKADKDRSEPGFESIPGAGPNPTKSSVEAAASEIDQRILRSVVPI